MWGKGFRFKGISWDGGEAAWRALVLGKSVLLVDGGRRRKGRCRAGEEIRVSRTSWWRRYLTKCIIHFSLT